MSNATYPKFCSATYINLEKFVGNLAGGNAVQELQGALEEYLPLIVGLTKRGF